VSIASRRALLTLIAEAERNGDAAALPFYATPAAEVSAFAARYDLDLSFLNLIMTFATGDAGFWRQVVEALPPGADGRIAAARWIEWLWTDAETGLRNRVGHAALRASGDRVCDLQRRAAAGEDVARSDWRQVRARLVSRDGDDAVQAAAIEGIAAAAWDLGSAPGAAADMIYAWKAMLFAEVGRDLEWTAEKQSAANERFDRMAASARANADAAVQQARAEGTDVAPEGGPIETTPFYRDVYNKGVADFIAANPSDLDLYGQRTRATVDNMYQLGRDGLLRQVASLSTAPASMVSA
jgi:hypothetical protein